MYSDLHVALLKNKLVVLYTIIVKIAFSND